MQYHYCSFHAALCFILVRGRQRGGRGFMYLQNLGISPANGNGGDYKITRFPLSASD